MADSHDGQQLIRQRRPSVGRREPEQLGSVNNVRTFVSKTNPSQATSVSIKSIHDTPIKNKRTSVTSSMQSNSATKNAKKKKAYTQLKKRQNVFQTPRQSAAAQKGTTRPKPSSRQNSPERRSIHNSGQKSHPKKDKTMEEMMPSLGVSMNQEIDNKNLVGLQQAEQSVMTQKMHAFLRKNSNFEETKGFQRRPEDYQIEMKDETVYELEEPLEDELNRQSFTIADDHSSPETLVTQISVEETNIKKLGVSRTASKAHMAGSLTDRQTHLLLLSTNSNPVSQTQMETSIQAEGPTMAKNTFQRLGSATRSTNIDKNRLLLGKTQTLGSHRLSLNNHQPLDRSSSLQVSGRTTVTPFLQRALINSDQDMTSKEFGEKLQKLKCLDKIDVSQNKITKIPYIQLLNHAQTLTYLCLDNNQILEISEDTLRHLPNIATLKLRANKLNRIPDSLFSLAQLRILDISSNKLTSLSAKVSLLRQLQWLNISQNRLEGLPNSIGYLEKLESITSEFFVYLEDQGGACSNLQVDSTGDADLDWITRHHQRQTISKNAPDNRFSKLMEFMRLQIAVVSTFIELVHEFQHIEGEYYMIDSEPAMMTDESEQLLQSVQSFNNMQSPSQMFEQPLLSEPSKDLTATSLLTFGKYLPRCEYNELVTVFRTLSPSQVRSKNTMLHLLVMHNHPHLLKQYIAGVQKIVANTSDSLQSVEVRAQFQSSVAQQNLLRNLQLHFNSKLRAAVNGVNEKGFSVLELVLQGVQTELADTFISLLGKHLDLECQKEVCSTPRSEIKMIVPGNQQNNTIPYQPTPASKIHPIVMTLTSGRFHLTSKLIDIALDFHLKRRAQETARKRYDSLLKEPSASQHSLAISSVVQNHAALQLTSRFFRNSANSPFNLNIGDMETGMTYLHHLFANFDSNPDKAANLFRKLNSLHIRHASTATGTLGRGVKSIAPRSPDNRTLALRGERTKHFVGGSIDTRNSASQNRLFIGANTHSSMGQFNIAAGLHMQAESDKSQHVLNHHHQEDNGVIEGPDIEPLELNPMTHYFETPFDFAVEHYQHSAVQFALNWNYNNLQSISHAKQNSKQGNGKRSHTVGPLSSLERQLSFTRSSGFGEGVPRKFFNVMNQDNPRQLTPLHRVIINGNYNALKIILDSPLFYEAHKFKSVVGADLRGKTLIDLQVLDKLGRDPRDYAHKIVFMSKLLSQAACRQVWHQADLHSIQKKLVKQKQLESEMKTKGKLATYDMLISHTSMSTSQKNKKLTLSLQASNIIGGGLLGDGTVLQHSCLNSYFLKTDKASKAKYSGHLRREHTTRNSAVVDHGMTIKLLKKGDRSQTDHRLVKSFASNSNTPINKTSTPQYGFSAAAKSVFSTDQKNGKKPLHKESQKSDNSTIGVIHRQSLPTTTVGFTKAKSMAFQASHNKSRVDRFERQQRLIVENATAKAQKQRTQDIRHLQQSGTNETKGGGVTSSSALQFARMAHSGAHSSLGMHRQNSQESCLVVVKEKSGLLEAAGRQYGKTESQVSELDDQQMRHYSKTNQITTTQDDDNDSFTVLETVTDKEMRKSLQRKGRPSTVKTLLATKASPYNHFHQKSMKFGKILDQTSLTVATDQLKASHTPVLKNQTVTQLDCSPPDNKSDALKLADLEGVKQPAETSMEITHDFNDSGSANSFTPLPSIQNDYALEIKSFNNGQVKKPYSQQLSTNRFKAQFDLIMDNHMAWNQNTLFDLDSSPGCRRREVGKENGCSGQDETHGVASSSLTTKELKSHQKMQILFQIVKAAKDMSKLQDAKDILDFIQYEIGTQMQLSRSHPKREEAPQITSETAKFNNLAAQPASKPQETQKKPWKVNKPKAPYRKMLHGDICFMQQEVSHLRCQLDLMSKQLVAVPSRVKYVQHASTGLMLLSNRTVEQRSQRGLDVNEQTVDSSLMGSINPNAAFSIRNASIAATTEVNTATELIDVAHLTEADEDSSQDFDENLNTLIQKNRKKTTILVQPSEMLSTKSAKVALGSESVKQTKLASLLSGKRDHPQKLNLSKMRKSLQQLDQSSGMLSRSRENLETDEGHTVVNQPLVSADVQSFSDRLSHHRDSSMMNKAGTISLIQSQRFKQKSLLEMANRQVQRMIPRSSGSIQLTAESGGGKTDESFTATAAQPKLKYAAFAQIDLSNFDFQRRNNSIQTSGPILVQEKSRSAIGLQKDQLSATRVIQLERPHTGIGSEANSSLPKRQVEKSHSFLEVAPGSFHQILSTEEKKSRSKFMSIKEEDGGGDIRLGESGLSIHSHQKSLLKRSDSLKGISVVSQSKKARVLGSAKKKPVGTKKHSATTNFGALTSQKVGLKVLQDYQQSKSRISVTQLKQAEIPVAAGGGSKIQAHPNSMTLKPPQKLDYLTSAAISLPPQTAKNQGNTGIQKQLKLSAISTKANYIQPKISRSETKVAISTLQRQIKMKQTMSRNAPQAAGPTQATQQSATAPTRTIDGAPGQLKIKTHHRLLRDLIDSSSSVTRSRGGHPHK